MSSDARSSSSPNPASRDYVAGGLASNGAVSRGADLLDRIVAVKQSEVAALQSGPAAARPPAGRRSSYSMPGFVPGAPLRFEEALRRPVGAPLRIVAECKRASPSHGLIRPDYDPATLAKTYANLGAAALSILTDREFFQGELAHLQAAREASGLPALRKDFTIDPLQIYEARSAGADAVLLIVRILSEQQLSELQHAAAECGLAALVEVHSEAEADRALASGARIIGVNHRDLDTLRMDLSLTERIVPRLRRERPELILLGESGVENPEGLARVAPHADAILIGAGLLKSADIASAWRSIFG